MRKKLNAGIAAAAMVALLGVGASTAGASSQDGIFQVKATKIESNGKKFEATHGLRVGGGGGGPVDPGTPEPDAKGVMTFKVENCPAAYTPFFPGTNGFTGDVTWSNGANQDTLKESNLNGGVVSPNFLNWALADWITSIGGMSKLDEAREAGSDVYDELIASSTPLSYTVKFEGNFDRDMTFNDPRATAQPYSPALSCVTAVTEWKNTKQESAEGGFHAMFELKSVVQPPKTITNMNTMFRMANKFNQDISGWDVSNVTTWDEIGNSISPNHLPPKFR